MEPKNTPKNNWKGQLVTIGLFILAAVFMILFLNQCDKNKQLKKDINTTTTQKDNCEKERQELIKEAQGQRLGALQIIDSLKKRVAANKATVQKVPYRLVSTGVRENLVKGGFLSPYYVPDTDAIYVAVYDTTENRALLESTGLVNVSKSAWDSLANGYSRLKQDSTRSANQLTDCQEEKKAIVTNAQANQKKLDRIEGKTVVGKGLRQVKKGIDIAGYLALVGVVLKILL